MSEGTLAGDHTQDSHHHSTTIEIPGNGQVNAAFEDTETLDRTSRTQDVANGNPANAEETPSTPLAGQRDVNHHMNGTATSDTTKVNGAVEPKSPPPTSNDVKDVAEAVNLELVNMQPFNNGIPVKKESTELDIGDPYDEYFVPVNQHKKYMRGEKLYVTQDKRRSLGGGKRKCCWGLLSVIVLGIIVAILIGVLLSQDSNSPVKSRTFNGDIKGAGLGGVISTPPPKSTQQPPRPTTDISEMFLQRVIEGELTIDNMEFTPGLANPNTSEFMTLATSLEEELRRALFDRQTLLYGSSDITVKVLEFKSGSVIVIYRVGWQFKPGVHNSPDPLTKDSLKTRLQEHLRNNDGFLYNYRMQTSSLKSNRILDNCQMNNNNCSHTCHFNSTTLLFSCSCPPDYILDSDGKTCIKNDFPTFPDLPVDYDEHEPGNEHDHHEQEPDNEHNDHHEQESENEHDDHHEQESENEHDDHHEKEFENEHDHHDQESENEHDHHDQESENEHDHYEFSSEPSSTSEHVPIVEEHPSIESEPIPEMEPSEQPASSTEHHMPEMPPVEPEKESTHKPHESTEMEELPVHLQHPETSSKTSEEQPSSSESDSSPELYPYLQHELPEMNSSTESKTEPTMNTEPVVVPNENEASASPEPAINFIPPNAEMSTEHEMHSESETSSETSRESNPVPLTEYVTHISSEEPQTMKEETSQEVEHLESNNPTEPTKPLSELVMTSAEPQQPTEENVLVQPVVSTNETEHETKIISGEVPMTVNPVLQTTTSSSFGIESKSESNETNQTEHAAGSMRSLNLEHSTDYVIQQNEMEVDGMFNSSSQSQDINSNQSVYIPIESEISSVITTEMPVTMLPNQYTASFSPMEMLPTDLTPSMEHEHEPNETMKPKEEESPTDLIQTSTETFHHKEMNTMLESNDETKENSKMQTEIVTEPTMISSVEGMTGINSLASSITTEKQSLVNSTNEIKITESSENEEAASIVPISSNETTTGVMAKELELGITQTLENLPGENSTMMDQPVTMTHFKQEIEENEPATEPNMMASTDVKQDMNKISESVQNETATPPSPTFSITSPNDISTKEENLKDITTHLPSNLEGGETTMPPTTMVEEVMPGKQSDEENVNTKLESTDVLPMEVTTMPSELTSMPTTLEKEKINEKEDHVGSTDLESIHSTVSKIDVTTVKSENMVETLREVEQTTKHDSNHETSTDITNKEIVTEMQNAEPSPMVPTEQNSNIIVSDHSKAASESTENPMFLVTTEINSTKSNETISSPKEEEKDVHNFVTERKMEVTTIQGEVSENIASNITMKSEEHEAEHATKPFHQEHNETSTATPLVPLNTPHVSSDNEEMPLISITHIPDLSGPYSVDTVFVHPTPHPNENSDDDGDVNIGSQSNQTYHYQIGQDDHHTDITADTLNSLDDDYNEEDKKKYYKPAKTKNFKNFKIQEVNIPIDSLADETTKDIQHSKDVPDPTTKFEDITTLSSPVIKDEITSNDAFTTISPLFKAERSSKQPPLQRPHDKDEHLNGLFFSNEAETTISPLFEITGLAKNKSQEPVVVNNKYDSNQLGSEIKADGNKEAQPVTEMISTNEGVLQNATLEKDHDVMSQPELTTIANHNNSSGSDEPEIVTTKPENRTETSTMKLMDLETTPRLFNTSGLLEILNPSKKCASGQFACADGSGCIKAIQRCDAVRDCDDGSDEMNCEEQGCPGNFQCKNRQCLKRSLVCDSTPNCADGSDEIDCENWKCLFDEVSCSDSKQCIPVLWKCDGKGDCKDNTDEFGCRDSCANDEFLCPEGRCIPHNSTCNGINDCLKGEDEVHCSTT